MKLRITTVIALTLSMLATVAAADIKVGYIGSLSSDTGLSTLRGAQMSIDELNKAGGVMGQQIKLVTADTGEDPTEGIRAYEYLAETEKVNFIISGCIDDVSLAWLPRMQEYRIPTLDTWTSNIGIIDMEAKNPKAMRPYFMNIAADEALATLYINFGKDVLKKRMGWNSTVVLAEDTAFGQAITGLVKDGISPVAGIKVKEVITYDVNTVDFAPLFARAEASGADFIYQISSVNAQVISSQYVKLQVPMAMTGVNTAAFGAEYWKDTGGAGGGISTLTPFPSAVGMEFGPTGQAFLDAYQARYHTRPIRPHFNGFNAYFGLKEAMAAAEQAGGFGDADAWAAAMEKQDLVLKRNGKLWMRFAFWGKDEIEPVTGRTYPHNARFQLSKPFDKAPPSMVVVQWYENGKAAVVYPKKYATGEFTVPSWVKK